ncbi:MAG TPA: 16S rRNA (cytidine(1402)-2'-O)-methyltransferase [Actinomycetota bacterium]
MAGRLVLCATPIGNLEDVSARALRMLAEADVVACEDTRRTRKLLTHYGVSVRELVVYNDVNERRQAPALLERLQRGATVVLVSDAGTPGLSDPGYRLVSACVEADVAMEVVPGPNAAVAALALSGLPPGRFAFEGFLPRKPGPRRRRIEELATERRTLVLYESPHRVEATLADLLEGLGDRACALARELTKMHEEVRRGSVAEVLDGVRATPPKGEIVLVVEGAVHSGREEADPAELAARARALMDEGMARPAALSAVAKEAGVARKKVFDALVED